MSALNIVRQRDRLHFVTDGLAYSPEGVMHATVQKVAAFPHLPAMFSIRGPLLALPIIAQRLSNNAASFDDVVDGVERLLPTIVDDHADLLAECGLPHVELFIGGYSERSARFEAYTICSDDAAGRLPLAGLAPDDVVASASEAYVLQPLDDVLIVAPNIAASDVTAALGRTFASIEQIDDIEEFGFVLLELQRARLISNGPGLAPCHNVGGFAQITTLTRDRVSSRIFHRWPDEVGALIEPESIDWPTWRDRRKRVRVDRALVGTEGMSRLKRDMLVKKAAKGKVGR